jgi:lipid II:glycine glycyltransferase (peptidoglycan interpeptide bridge formation enzyme)
VAGQLDSRPFCVRFDLDWVLSRRPSLDQDDAAVAPGPEQPGIPAGDPVKLRCGFRLAPLRKAGADIQPPDTVIIDLAAGREAVLAGMKAKTRYNVRLAEKKSVRIATAGPDGLDDWYRLYQETATRDRIAVHSLEYYRTLLEQNPDRCELLLASHEDDLLAGIIMLYCGQRATYLYGASANIKRNLMPAYLLQWTAMQRAIDRGCTSYDCFGIPPSSDPAHPMHGLFQFKTGFGGETVHHAGSWDAPVRPWLYALYGKAETLRQFWFKKVKKH